MRSLDALKKTLGDRAKLRERWALDGRLFESDDQLCIEIGEPDTNELAELVESFEAIYRATFPSELRRILSMYNGLSIDSDPEARLAQVPAENLTEPGFFPANVYADHYLLHDADVLGQARPFVFGEIPDSGFFTLGVRSGQSEPAVFWIDVGLSRVSPLRVANSFGDFIHDWCHTGLYLPAVLGRAGVPGWGA